MRVFLDENVDPALGEHLIGHVVASVRSEGWFGVSNGELINRIEGSHDVFLSHDRGLEHQQAWNGRNLALIVMQAPSTAFPSYAQNLGILLNALIEAKAGTVTHLEL